MAQQIFEEINKLSLKFMCKSKIKENNSEKEQGWKTDHFRFQNLANSYSRQDSVVMA